jgi:hypothetical protein
VGVFKPSLSLKKLKWRHFFALPCLLASACTNNFVTPNSTATSAPTPTASSSSTPSGSFPLSQVQKTPSNPGQTFDLIDDGSGSFATNCPIDPAGAANADPSLTPTICECSYSYSSASAPNQQVFTAVTYHESDLMRCSYVGIPADVKTVSIAVHVKTTDAYSTSINYKLANSGGAYVDFSNIINYVSPVRYQCRDTIFIPYIFDAATVYDPVQSEDVHLSYPIDFYASSLGAAISAYVGSNNANWNCPGILNPSAYLSGSLSTPSSALATYTAANHINLNVYSKVALHGSKQIYPPGITDDRSTFFLLKATYGVTPVGTFSVAVNSILAPGIVTSSGTLAPLGYGALPIATGGSGSGTETCPSPSAVAIPAGYQWMKLWQFRSSLPQRTYATSGATPSIANVTGIVCNPGEFSVTQAAYVDCAYDAASTNLSNLSAAHPFSDRHIQGSAQCIQLDDGSGNYCLANTHPGPGCTAGGDLWKAENIADATGSMGCFANPKLDPMNICPAAVKQPINFNVGSGQLDTGANATRYDFLFVVTPPTINLADMLNTASSSPSLPYQPYRFMANTDCNSPDPDAPLLGDCNPKYSLTNYALKLHDVSNNGDPPANDPNRAGVFPVCVLQKTP